MPRKKIPLHFNLFEVELWKAKMKWNNVNRKENPGKKKCFVSMLHLSFLAIMVLFILS